MRTGTSLAASLAMHGIVISALVGAVAGGASPTAIDRDAPHDDPYEEQPEEQPEELGIEESLAETPTWIGYEEYEEHLARLSEVEQAAMLAAPTAGGGGGSAGSSAAAAPTPPPLPIPPMEAADRRSPTSSGPTMPTPPIKEADRLVDTKIRLDPTDGQPDSPEPADAATPPDANSNDYITDDQLCVKSLMVHICLFSLVVFFDECTNPKPLDTII